MFHLNTNKFNRLSKNTLPFIDNKKGTFCVLAIYSAIASKGNPQKDFAREWKDLVAKLYQTEANPKTETQTTTNLPINHTSKEFTSHTKRGVPLVPPLVSRKAVQGKARQGKARQGRVV